LTIYVPLIAADINHATALFGRVIVPVMAKEHQEPGEDERNGAYLGIRDPQNKDALRIKAGSAADDQFASYSDNIGGKNDTLHDNPHFDLSWEVHKGDTSKMPYPGAIRSDFDDRIAISGFSWQRDTIGSLWLARKLGRISMQNAFALAKRCGLTTDFKRLFFKLNNAEKALKQVA
jgi:hypothetical protein